MDGRAIFSAGGAGTRLQLDPHEAGSVENVLTILYCLMTIKLCIYNKPSMNVNDKFSSLPVGIKGGANS